MNQTRESGGMQEIDVLAVGDTVTDTFIKLPDNQAHAYTNEQGAWLAMPFGAKIPFEHAEVVRADGNASNAAISFARLGLNSALMTNVGGDMGGRDIISALHTYDVDTRFVRINPGKVSNHNYILWYKDERTILTHHEEYKYHWPHLHPHEMPKWVYFSSVSNNALVFHDALAEWLEKHAEVRLAFSPGTFQIKTGAERLARIYKRASVLAVNREEASTITGVDHDNIHGLLDKLHDLGPETVVISDGHKGSYASDGQTRLRMPIYPDPAPPYERTGAGDAFTSTFVAAIIKGSDIEGALQWAPINSMSVTQQVGAHKGLLNERQLTDLLKRAPASYRPQKL